MPANLSPAFYSAEERYRQALSDEERLIALEEMMATIPKHKGTEKMQADIKRRIAKLKEGLRKGGQKGPRRRELFRVPKEGAGQIALIGPPNSGKSSIMGALTRASPEVADYPYTTRLPMPGMVQWENIQIQFVDMPPITPITAQAWMWALLRLSDGLLLVVDAGDDDVLHQTEELIEFMSQNNLSMKNEGELGFGEKRVICAANKWDMPESADRVQLLGDILGDSMEIVPCSTKSRVGLDVIPHKLFFDVLGKIRVYTRPPGKKPDFSQPFVLDKGTTVLGAARDVHKEIADSLKYAKVWGTGVFDGQMVPRDHVLSDGDIVVFYT